MGAVIGTFDSDLFSTDLMRVHWRTDSFLRLGQGTSKVKGISLTRPVETNNASVTEEEF